MIKIIATGLFLTAMTTAANAQNMFAFMGDQDATNTIIIEPINAEADGYVAVFDNHTGEVGELLGVARVYAGANRQLRVQTGRTIRQDVIAFLFAGDSFTDPANALDSVEIDIEN